MKLSERELAELAALRPRDRQECLPEALLVRAACGDLSPAERESVADHLAFCPECAGEHRLLSSLRGWAEKGGQPRERAVAPSSPLGLRLLATAAALTAVGLIGWNLSLHRRLELSDARATEMRREVERASLPELNPVIADLEPVDAARGAQGTAPAQLVVVPPGARFVSFVLVAGADDLESHELSLTDVRGAEVWSGRGLKRAADQTFTVALPARLLPAGAYRIRLTGVRGTERSVMEEFAFRVERR
jgi:hypothetical protein